MRAGRDGGRMSDTWESLIPKQLAVIAERMELPTLEDLLALVDLGQLLLEHLVALLADLNDPGALDTPS